MTDSRVRLVLADGTALTDFHSYRIRQDVRQMAGSFVLTIKPVEREHLEVIEALIDSPDVTVEVDGAPIMTGRVGEPDIGQSRQEGSWANIVGTDLLGIAAKSCLPRGFSVAGLSVADSVAAALAEYELPVIGSNDANRELISRRRVHIPERWELPPQERGLQGDPRFMGTPGDGRTHQPPTTQAWLYGDIAHRRDRWLLEESGQVRLVSKAKEVTLTDRDERALVPSPGETIGSWIARVCEVHRLLVWLTADGLVCLTRPRYDQINIPRIVVGGPRAEGSVERAELCRRPIDQSARIEVCGRVGRHGEANVVGFAQDDDLIESGWRTYRLVVEDGLRDLERAMAKAARTLHDEQLGSWEWRCTLSGHSVDERLICHDMMAHVTHALCGIERGLYCIARDFTKSRERGTVADLTFVRPNLLLAE